MPENNPENIPTKRPNFPPEEKDQSPKGNLLSGEEYRLLMGRAKKKEEEANKPDSELDVPSNELAPFDISGENVRRIIIDSKNKGESVPEDKQNKTPEEPPKGLPVAPESEDQVSALREDLVGSLQEVVTKWSEANTTNEQMTPESIVGIDSSYSNMQKAFFKLTGESLDRKVRVEAIAEAEKQDKRIISRKEFFGEKKTGEYEKEEQKRRIGAGIKASWHKLPDQIMQKYVAETGSVSAAQKKYARDLDAKRQELKKKGIDFPIYVYYDFLSQGAEPQNATKKGLFAKKIFVPCPPGFLQDEHGKVINKATSWKVDPKEFEPWSADEEAKHISQMKNDVGARMKEDYSIGRKSWMERKIRKIESIAENSVQAKVTPEEIIPRDDKAFGMTIEATKKENALDLLSDEELDSEMRKLEKKFHERMDKVKKIIGEDCEPICKALGLSPEKSEAFIKAAKNERNLPDLDEKSKSFLENILENLKRITGEYQSAIAPMAKLKAQRAKEKTRLAQIEADKKIEKALAEIRGKLAAA